MKTTARSGASCSEVRRAFLPAIRHARLLPSSGSRNRIEAGRSGTGPRGGGSRAQGRLDDLARTRDARLPL